MTEQEMITFAQRESKRRWREAHKEHIRRYNRKWRSENQDRIKQYNRRYWLKKAAELLDGK